MISFPSKIRGGNVCSGVLAIWLAFASRGATQVTPINLPKDISSNSFSMTVKVVDAISGKPLGNSVVLLPSMSPAFGKQTTNQWRFPTDASGVATVRVVGEAVAFNYFSLAVSNGGYPMKSADWNTQSGSVRSALPTEYTLRLERGRVIGGFVRDERGQPVEGVKVLPWGNGAASYRYDPAAARAREYSALARDDHAGIVTDAKGFWAYTNFPTDITALNLDVVRPDGSRSLFVTAVMARQFQMETGDEVGLEELQATNALLVIKDGVTLRGVVVDEAGKPVPNAAVKERAGSGWNVPIQQVTNDAQGRFALPHRTGSQYLLTAEADGYTISSTIATLSPDLGEVKLVLPPAQPVRLRLLGENDEPVAGSEISLPEYRNRGHLLTWKATTDAGGLVVWTNAPRQTLSVQITSTNYPMRMARLEPVTTEQVVRVRKESATSITVHLRVLEEGGRQPLTRFAVWQDLQPHSDFKEVERSGTNGEFKTVLKLQDFPEGRAFGYRFQVRAEGYLPWSGEMSYFDEGDFEATVTLKKAARPVGVVLLPDGQPAADAKVMLIAGQGSLFMNSPEDQYPGTGVITLKSGADGSFKFDGAEEEQRVVVIHRSGFASVTVEELRRTGKIPLQKWARIEGVLRTGGKPLAKERLSIKSPLSWAALDSHHLVFSATTDTDGRFVFTNLPPGNYVLYRTPHNIMGMATTESHRMILALAAGESKQIDYGFGGRTVVGRIEAGGEVDWKNDPHLISVKLPPAPPNPNYYAYADPKEFEKARRAHGKSKAVLDYERNRQQFQLVFDKDGNFKVDDVPPGTYELSIRATKPNKDSGRNRFQRTEEVLGSVRREITIPAGAAGEEFDLGAMDMEVKESLGAPSAPLDFAAEQLDGKPFNLVSLRGRPTVLCFWGGWAPGSLAKLESIHAAVAKLEPHGRPALVTVNLDSSNEAARAGVASLETGWIHTRLAGAAMVEVTERLSVDTLPMVLLLDGQGRVMGRDLDGKRLASSVKRLVANKN